MSEALPGSSSASPLELRNLPLSRLAVLGWAGFLTLLVTAPWLRAGYLFGTDWTGPRRFDLPTAVSSSAPVQIVLAAISRVLPPEWTGKLLVIGLVFLGAILAYRAVPSDSVVGRAAGSAVFTFNPFVFGRLHYGQVFLLAGYALLPWVAKCLLALCERPQWKSGVLLGVAVSLVAAFTVHLLLVSMLPAAVVCAAYLLAAREKLGYIKRLGVAVGAAGVSALVLCSYWLVPYLLGRSVEATIIGQTGSGQLEAYAAVPDPRLGLVPNLLGLYGFWAEDSGRFTSMKAFVPGWPVALAILLLVAAVGVAREFRRRDSSLRPWVVGLVVSGAIALALETGISNPLTAGFVRWLDATIPLYKGMRDAGKWAALLALVYSQLFGLGTAAVLDWLRQLKVSTATRGWLAPAAAGLLIALPIYYGNGLLFGLHGEIQPSEYPAGWYAADRVLLADPHPGRAVFLPWHEYMSYSFIQNQNKVVASPAPSFFSIPVLASTNPEVAGVTPPGDPDQLAVSQLVGQGASGNWATVLASLRVKYVLLAREVDWESYAYLDRTPGLTRVADFGSIVVYRLSN